MDPSARRCLPGRLEGFEGGKLGPETRRHSPRWGSHIWLMPRLVSSEELTDELMHLHPGALSLLQGGTQFQLIPFPLNKTRASARFEMRKIRNKIKNGGGAFYSQYQCFCLSPLYSCLALQASRFYHISSQVDVQAAPFFFFSLVSPQRTNPYGIYLFIYLLLIY